MESYHLLSYEKHKPYIWHELLQPISPEPLLLQRLCSATIGEGGPTFHILSQHTEANYLIVYGHLKNAILIFSFVSQVTQLSGSGKGVDDHLKKWHWVSVNLTRVHGEIKQVLWRPSSKLLLGWGVPHTKPLGLTQSSLAPTLQSFWHKHLAFQSVGIQAVEWQWC